MCFPCDCKQQHNSINACKATTHAPGGCWINLFYRCLQVGCGTVAELKVARANIIGHNTVHFCSLGIQICTSCGYQLQNLVPQPSLAPDFPPCTNISICNFCTRRAWCKSTLNLPENLCMYTYKQGLRGCTNMHVDECIFFCLLTNHEVHYNTVYTQRKDSHRNKINQHLGQEEDSNTIVATHILMTARSSRENRYLKVTIIFQ